MAKAKRSGGGDRGARRLEEEPRPRARQRAPARAGRQPAPDTAAATALVARLRDEGAHAAKIGGFDLDAVLRGKYVSLEKLESALGGGFGFCDVIFGWDTGDALYDNATVTGWHTAYPDVLAVLDPETLRRIPWEPGVVAMLADFRDGRGRPHPACPRSVLKRVRDHAASLGFEVKVGSEYEFFLFQETRDTLQAKGFRDLTPLDPGMFGYSWLRTGQDASLMHELLTGLAGFGIELEGLHTETGPGVYEAAIRYDELLRAADKAALFKTAVKQLAHLSGLSATFMAKWDATLPGCSGHLHQSLWRDGASAFFDPRAPHGMSKTMRHFIAGQLALMPELTALYSPTINSYKRYVPGLWAPLAATWGLENRTAAIRVIGAGSPSLRVEYRQTAADMNPYLAMAASLGAGLWGITHELELPSPVQGDAGTGSGVALPTSLAAATAALAQSRAARSILGAETIDHYVRTREWEVRQFERAVTDWERRRYFEII